MIEKLEKVFRFLEIFITYKVIFMFFVTNMVFTMIGVSALFILMPQMGLEPWTGYLLNVVALFMITCNAILAITYKLGTLSGFIEVKINWKKIGKKD